MNLVGVFEVGFVQAKNKVHNYPIKFYQMKFFYTYSNSKGKNSIQKSEIGQTNPILTLNKLQSTFSFNGGSKTYTILYTYTII